MSDGSVPSNGMRNATIAEGSALAAAGIGAAGLAGWLTGVAGLARWTEGSIPISPTSSGMLALLGAAVFIHARWPARRAARRTAAIVAIAVAGLSLLVLAQFAVGFDLGFERPFGRSPNSVLDAAAALVSPLTAIAALLAAVSLIDQFVFPLGARAGRHAAEALGYGVVAIALVVLVGYILGSPLFYGGSVHPVALPTASGLAMLGSALVATARTRPTELGDADAAAGPAFRRSWRMRYAPIALVAAAGLVLSGVLGTIMSRLEDARQHEDFARQADNTVGALKGMIYSSSDAVADVRYLFNASQAISRDVFREFATAELLHGAGVQTLDWVPRAADRQRAAYEAAARRDGVPGFRFTELDARGRLMPAARRAEYYPVLYLQSKQGAPTSLGFDVASEPTRRAALERARDTGALVASAPLTLLLPGRPLGVLLVYPVYRTGASVAEVEARRAALTGFAIGALRMDDLVAAARRTVRATDVVLELLDVSDAARPALLYADASAAAPQAGSIGTTTEFDVGGRTWMARVRHTATYLAAQRPWDAWLVFGGGLLLTILIAAHLYSLERYSATVEASRAALAESEGRFRAIAESASDGIITIDAAGTIVQSNIAAVREFGYEDGGLVNRNVSDIVPPSYVAAHSAGLARYGETGATLIVGEPLELPALHRDGSEFPVELSLAVWETHEGRFATAIVRDISDRKTAQAQREKLIAELQDALANVKTLRGLLPVCAWCRKVLDDRGAWRQMEAYVSEHTEAEFSHGMCPDCEKKFEAGEV